MDDKRPPVQLELVELGEPSESAPALGPPQTEASAGFLPPFVTAWWRSRPAVGKRVVAPIVAALWILLTAFLDPFFLAGVLFFPTVEFITTLMRQAALPYRGAKNRISYAIAALYVLQHGGIGAGMCRMVMDVCMIGVRGSSGIDQCADNSIVMGYILFPGYYASCGVYLAARQLGWRRCESMTPYGPPQ